MNFIAMLTGALTLNEHGVTWAPLAAGLIYAGVFAYMFHHFPNSEWLPEAQSE